MIERQQENKRQQIKGKTNQGIIILLYQNCVTHSKFLLSHTYAYCAGLALNKQKSPTPKAFGDFCVPQSGIEPESNL